MSLGVQSQWGWENLNLWGLSTWQHTVGTSSFSLQSLQRSKWGVGSRANQTFPEVRR